MAGFQSDTGRYYTLKTIVEARDYKVRFNTNAVASSSGISTTDFTETTGTTGFLVESTGWTVSMSSGHAIATSTQFTSAIAGSVTHKGYYITATGDTYLCHEAFSSDHTFTGSTSQNEKLTVKFRLDTFTT